MDTQQIYNKLKKHCPPAYSINEIISFAYPYRRVKINATVNKSPEKSIQKVYSAILRAIQIGYSEEKELRIFLGLYEDDFILRELEYLRERGLLDLVSGKWLVTEQGEAYIKDNSILKVLEEEDFEFLIDAMNHKCYPKKSRLISESPNKLQPEINIPRKRPELLEDKLTEIADVYKKSNDEAVLIDFNSDDFFDKPEFQDFILIEFIPIKSKVDEIEPYIEIRNANDLTLNKDLTDSLTYRYPTIVEQFSTSDRQAIAEIQDKPDLVAPFISSPPSPERDFLQLAIWETNNKFVSALEHVKDRILVESPWIREATKQYIGLIEKALKRNVTVYILYGIRGNDNHHNTTLNKLKDLDRKYPNFKLIHLPSHFYTNRVALEGSHRKIVIKDEDYFISGSFNFLSFNKSEGQKVANEESILVSVDVKEKWDNLFKKYKITL